MGDAVPQSPRQGIESPAPPLRASFATRILPANKRFEEITPSRRDMAEIQKFLPRIFTRVGHNIPQGSGDTFRTSATHTPRSMRVFGRGMGGVGGRENLFCKKGSPFPPFTLPNSFLPSLFLTSWLRGTTRRRLREACTSEFCRWRSGETPQQWPHGAALCARRFFPGKSRARLQVRCPRPAWG